MTIIDNNRKEEENTSPSNALFSSITKQTVFINYNNCNYTNETYKSSNIAASTYGDFFRTKFSSRSV